MIPLDEAAAYVVGQCPPRPGRAVVLPDAVGCVTTAPVVAKLAVPPFANTAMDGFAVRSEDTAGASPEQPVRLRVAATLAAGGVYDGVVRPGEAVRIMTGAPMPDGADAIVMVEHSVPAGGDSGDELELVDLTEDVAPGTHVRPPGGDIEPGDEVLAAGELVRAGHLGVLASLGHAEVEVVPRPVVGVLSTGDELVPVGEELERGQIHDSNRVMLLALLAGSGFTPVDLGLVSDYPEAVTEALQAGAAHCDAIMTSGGVSMGDFDVVKQVLDEIADMRWMQIAIRPAKPFAFGLLGEVPVFGLPGNPVSSFVSYELLARPALRRMAGHTVLDRPRVRAVVADGFKRRPDGKVHLPRVVVGFEGGRFQAAPVASQASHQLAATAGATGLALVPDGPGVAPGGEVDVILLDAAHALGGS